MVRHWSKGLLEENVKYFLSVWLSLESPWSVSASTPTLCHEWVTNVVWWTAEEVQFDLVSVYELEYMIVIQREFQKFKSRMCQSPEPYSSPGLWNLIKLCY